jgi:hypothetical protein
VQGSRLGNAERNGWKAHRGSSRDAPFYLFEMTALWMVDFNTP